MIRLLFISFFLISGCVAGIRSSCEAVEVAAKRVAGIDEGLKFVEVRKNEEIDGWEVYFESNDSGRKVNVLVFSSGASEVHFLNKD